MQVINIIDQLEVKRHAQWWKEVTNILRVLNVFKRECLTISGMVEARGDRDELESGTIYSGIDEYFCSEPRYIESDTFQEEDIKDIAPGKYVMVLEVREEVDTFEDDGRMYKSGKLIYMKKLVGEPL